MSGILVEFGWYPEPIEVDIDHITIRTLPDISDKVAWLPNSNLIVRNWFYPPLQKTREIAGGIIEQPYPSRIFGLAKTHTLSHAISDGPDHTEFLVWALSFFVGMRLTTTPMGFLDATPTKPGTLVDFSLPYKNLPHALKLSERFWELNKSKPLQIRRWIASVHALFISQFPQSLEFEKFIYLYGAIDACFSLMKDQILKTKKAVSHNQRIDWMCRHFNIPTPIWADASKGASKISEIRNSTLHESLFLDAPLGFASKTMTRIQGLTLEMKALLCRLLVALIGDEDNDYVRSPTNTRQRFLWSPGTQ